MIALLRKESWVLPSLAITLASVIFVLAFIPDRSGMVGALALLPLWLIAAGGMFCVYVFGVILRMMARGVGSPLSLIAEYVRNNWGHMLIITGYIVLAGLNMIAFMWMKPLLNYLVPFWADPMLADLDRAMFLGSDPASLLGWMNSDATAIFYHRGWFALMIFTLLLVLMQPPSRDKSGLMLTYFLLWSVVGPMVHILPPAAGPVFYQQLGYGDRFTTIIVPGKVAEAAAYLWKFYSTSGFGPGAGISAMPSVHIATTAWIVIAVYRFARPLLWLVAPAALAIFLLSISLGWHYAVDGLVGGALAALIWKLIHISQSPATGSLPHILTTQEFDVPH